MPKAILYGIPYELFWHLNPVKLAPFRKAYEEKINMKNQMEWVSGIYIREAISSCFIKGYKYPQEPINLFAKEKVDDSNPERDEILANAEMQMFSKVLQSQGLPKTVVE